MQRQKYQILYNLQYNFTFSNFCKLTIKPLNLKSTACTYHQTWKWFGLVTVTSYKDLITKLVSSLAQKSACLTDACLVPVQKRLFRIFYFILKQASRPPHIQSNCCLLQALTELKFTFFHHVRPCSMLDMYKHLEEPATSSFLHHILKGSDLCCHFYENLKFNRTGSQTGKQILWERNMECLKPTKLKLELMNVSDYTENCTYHVQ